MRPGSLISLRQSGPADEFSEARIVAQRVESRIDFEYFKDCGGYKHDCLSSLRPAQFACSADCLLMIEHSRRSGGTTDTSFRGVLRQHTCFYFTRCRRSAELHRTNLSADRI